LRLQSRRAAYAIVSPFGLYVGEIILDCIRWSNCPAKTQVQVDRLLIALQHQLKEVLVGIYLHGSLATGCFNPTKSDVDLLVVVHQRLLPEMKRHLIETLLGISKLPHPIEISFLNISDLHPWQYPTPFELHYSEDWRKQFEQDLVSEQWQHWFDGATDNDLAAHITVTKKHGVCLWGESIDSVFPDVPHEDFALSIASDLKWTLERLDRLSVYGVLNACRVCAFFQNGLVLSKVKGAEWALEKMPSQFHATITSALKTYRSTEQNDRFQNVKESRQLLEYVASLIGATG